MKMHMLPFVTSSVLVRSAVFDNQLVQQEEILECTSTRVQLNEIIFSSSYSL